MSFFTDKSRLRLGADRVMHDQRYIIQLSSLTHLRLSLWGGSCSMMWLWLAIFDTPQLSEFNLTWYTRSPKMCDPPPILMSRFPKLKTACWRSFATGPPD